MVLSVDNNRNITTNADEYYKTKVKLDVEGNLRSLTDARELVENSFKGNTVIEFKYDMLGNSVYKSTMDAGQRWTLLNILGNPLRTWDERSHEFQYAYDSLHRPLQSKVLGGDGPSALNHIFDRIVYGESILNAETLNLRGNVYRHYDTGGLVETPEFNFKGEPKITKRRLFRNYKVVANWTDVSIESDLEDGFFSFVNETDALGRITKQISPDLSSIFPSYNETGLLDSERVLHTGSLQADVLIERIDYDEKSQRSRIVYGNGVTTNFDYDSKTFRLKHLQTTRQNNDPLQDWYYTFDPVGNITHIEDKNIPVVFFDNQKVTGIRHMGNVR